MPTDEVNDESDWWGVMFVECFAAYNKDLEQGISQRVSGTDFKRILISTVQVDDEDPHDFLSTHPSDLLGSS